MRSTLKIAVPIVLVFGVVFAVTVIKKLDTSSPLNGDGGDGTPVDVPLQSAYTSIRYDPESAYVWDRHFDGFHEVSDEAHPVSFWFKNRNTSPMHVRILGRSCGSCTSAHIAHVPPDALDKLVAKTAAGLFPVSAFPVPDLLTAIAVGEMNSELKWHKYDFPLSLSQPTAPYTVPAAADDDHPTWAVVKLAITVNGIGPVTRYAQLGMQTENMPVEAEQSLAVSFQGINPFEVAPDTKDVGSLPEGTSPQTFDIIYFSATRSQSGLPPPGILVDSNAPFIDVRDPVPMTEAERTAFAQTMAKDERGGVVPVRGAYRIPVTVSRALPDGREPDIGPFEAGINISGPGASGSRRVTVKGVMTGVIALASGDDLKIGKNGQWDVKYGTTTRTRLASDRPGLEVEVVPEETTPGFLDVSLGPVEVKSDRRYWPMTIVVPANTGFGPLPRDAAIVLRTKGPNPITVRIPVEGRGFRRN